jgi:hypothetical protein
MWAFQRVGYKPGWVIDLLIISGWHEWSNIFPVCSVQPQQARFP